MRQLVLALTTATTCVAEQCDIGEDGPLLQRSGLMAVDAKVQTFSGSKAGTASSEVDSESAASSGSESEKAEVLGLMASSSVWEDLEKAPAKFWSFSRDKYINRFGDAVLREKVEAAEVPVLSEEEQLALATAPGARRVLSDLDDTIICSAATIFHGIDANCAEKGEIYPGVGQFQLELGLGPAEDENATAPPSVVPVSARPQELKFLLAIKPTKPEFKHYVELSQRMFGSRDAWGIDLVNAQYGSVWSSTSVALNDFDKHLPWLKFTGWLNVRSLGGFPTIFVGDNGQGDARSAELMLSQKTSVEGNVASPLLGAFIHHIQPLRINSAVMNTSWESGRDGTQATLASYGIHLFHNYAHAACIAYKNGFISDPGYLRIMSSILDECSIAIKPNRRHERRLCTLLSAEFELGDHGQLSIRSPDDCGKSTSSLEGLLQAEEVYMVDGYHMVGRCHELDSDLFMRLIATKKQQSKLESGYVYWAIEEGTYCTTPCGESCAEVSQGVFWGQDPSWQLLETSSYSGDLVTCPNPLQRSNICQVVY